MKKMLFGLLAVAAVTLSPASSQAKGKEKIKNVIYLIGDGMGLSQVSMAIIEGGYAPTAFSRSQNVALISTYSANNRVTDSAAAGTALATGKKTNNGMLGMTPDGQHCESIMARAKEEGYATGLVVTVYLQHATPGAFYAHVPSRGDLDVISKQFVESKVDVAFGGGKKFLSADNGKGGTLIDDLLARDYKVVYGMDELKGIDRGKVVGLFADEYMPTVPNGRDANYLGDATKKALEILSNNTAKSKKGFVLMVEGSQIDSECHANNAAGALAETQDFNRAIAAAMDFADTHPGTLVVVTADHETGGLAVTSNKADFLLPESGIGCHFGTTGHSGTLVPVYLYGAGAEEFNGVMDNTDLPKKIAKLLNLK